MKIFDMHIHCASKPPVPHELIAEMAKAGVYGGCVFSDWPDRAVQYENSGSSFEDRLKEIKAWCDPYLERLFPIMWIHPYEDDIMDKIDIAVKEGVAGFKIICTDFYVHEDGCLKVLDKIAKTGLPVIFHSGILWSGAASSKFNRPVYWEALMDIEGLRFSMGHCSWPWTDECIALYGQFRYAQTVRKTSEMFFDLTPGTPPIYRKDLLTKLFKVDYGFDTTDHIMFGTDCSAHHYRAESTERKLTLDGGIMDELGVSEETRKKIYCDNLMRFLNKQ